MENELYQLNIWNCGKKLPANYRELVIPEIERATKRIMGDGIKYTIYNALVGNYNRGISKGCLDSLSVFSQGKEKKFYYSISEKKITIKLK